MSDIPTDEEYLEAKKLVFALFLNKWSPFIPPGWLLKRAWLGAAHFQKRAAEIEDNIRQERALAQEQQ